jgi:hypothetical protein
LRREAEFLLGCCQNTVVDHKRLTSPRNFCYCKKVPQERLLTCVLKGCGQEGSERPGWGRQDWSRRGFRSGRVQQDCRAGRPDRFPDWLSSCGGQGTESHRRSRVLHLGGLCGPEPAKRSWLGAATAGQTLNHRPGFRLSLERNRREAATKASLRLRGGLVSLAGGLREAEGSACGVFAGGSFCKTGFFGTTG